MKKKYPPEPKQCEAVIRSTGFKSLPGLGHASSCFNLATKKWSVYGVHTYLCNDHSADLLNVCCDYTPKRLAFAPSLKPRTRKSKSS